MPSLQYWHATCDTLQHAAQSLTQAFAQREPVAPKQLGGRSSSGRNSHKPEAIAATVAIAAMAAMAALGMALALMLLVPGLLPAPPLVTVMDLEFY